MKKRTNPKVDAMVGRSIIIENERKNYERKYSLNEQSALLNKAKEKFNKMKGGDNDTENEGDISRESIIKKMEERAKELGGVVGEYTSTDLTMAREEALVEAKRKLGTGKHGDGSIHSEKGFKNSDGSYTVYLIYTGAVN